MVRLFVFSFFLPFFSLAIPAFSDGNLLVIEQSNSPGDLGNKLFVDQSQASSSLVGGLEISNELDLKPTEGARQTGSGNEAEITLQGAGGVARLNQYQTGGLSRDGNSAVISVLGGSQGLVGQIGNGNSANLTVNGAGSLGSILQKGDDNKAALEVRNDDIEGRLSQIGDGNEASLIVDGTANVDYTQQGTGLTTPEAVQVITNSGGTVSIIQRAIGAR